MKCKYCGSEETFELEDCEGTKVIDVRHKKGCKYIKNLLKNSVEV